MEKRYRRAMRNKPIRLEGRKFRHTDGLCGESLVLAQLPCRFDHIPAEVLAAPGAQRKLFVLHRLEHLCDVVPSFSLVHLLVNDPPTVALMLEQYRIDLCLIGGHLQTLSRPA